jgi:hypothetical protein
VTENEITEILDAELNKRLLKIENKIGAADKLRDDLKSEYAILWKKSTLRKSNKIKK